MLTGDFIQNRDASLRAGDRVQAIADAIGGDNLSTIDANDLAGKLMGDTIYANVLMLGCAWQRGLIPVSQKALRRAIELNGVKVDANQRAFTWGRIAATNPEAIQQLLSDGRDNVIETLDGMMARRRAFLVDYQDAALAERYVSLFDTVRAAESAISGSNELAQAVARSYFKLLSYKDEYEVARLHTRRDFLDSVSKDFGNKAKLRFHLAPPVLNAGVDARGRPRKREFGAWVLPVFRMLAKMRGLRGTRFDVFGFSAERRMERALISEFERLVDEILPILTPDNLDQASRLVRCFMDIRGYGPVKEESVQKVREIVEQERQVLLALNAKAA